MPPIADTRARARQRCKVACVLGVLFGSLPVVSRVFLGGWGFGGAGEIACACFLAGAYFYLVSRRLPHLRDAALMFDQASELAASGRADQAIAVLTRAIRQNPRVWQAFQYRGQLFLQLGAAPRALEDFCEAIRLAPEELSLHALRDRALSLLAEKHS